MDRQIPDLTELKHREQVEHLRLFVGAEPLHLVPGLLLVSGLCEVWIWDDLVLAGNQFPVVVLEILEPDFLVDFWILILRRLGGLLFEVK